MLGRYIMSVTQAHCVDCDLCCRHMSMQIDTPETEKEFDNIRWYLLHENVVVWICEEGDWYVEFKTPCTALTEEGLCSIYEDRPQIRRSYESEGCEKHGEYWEHFLQTPKDLRGFWQCC